MPEKNLWTKLGLIVLLVGLSLWQIYPPAERLKAGIDLAGGHSLLFEIDDAGLDQLERHNLAERVMLILRERVDPQGNRNLVWRPIGQNRLEIQMPRPPAGQIRYRQAFEEVRDLLAGTNVTEAQIRTALLLPPEERTAAFERMSELVPSRLPLFEQFVAADERYRALDAAAEDADALSPEQAREMDEALIQRNTTIARLLETNIDMRILGDVLELPDRQLRGNRLDEIKVRHADLAEHIDELTARFDVWARHKGMLDDPNDLMRLLRGTGVLEFRILAQRSGANPDMLDSSNPQYNEPAAKYLAQLERYGPRPRAGDNYRWFRIAKQDDDGFDHPSYVTAEYLDERYVLAHSTPDMGLIADRTWTLRRASQGRDQLGRLAVNFQLDTRGGSRFGRLTADNIGRPLTIFLDDEAISAATIQSQITTNGQISGTFSPLYVQYLVQTLEAGALPARLKEVPLQQKSVGPSLGETNRQKGMQAIFFSFLAVIIFMAIYYAYNGVIADIALLMNLVITLGIMSFLEATFTLPGIAGLVLMLGMAVDANVLIFERIREELQRGVSAKMAVKLGYEKAFSAILDSNVTTILIAVILGWIGSEEIRGFGLTLGIGLAISMFTALFVTRQFFNIMVPATLNKEETQRAWLGSGVLALGGGLLMGLGYLFHRGDPGDSNLIGLGKFLLVLFATSAVLLAALWGFRILYRGAGHQKAGRLPMLRLFSKPNIDWMGKHRIFWSISAVVIGGGIIFLMDVLPGGGLFDIEFVGGTSVQVQLKDEHQDLTDEQLLAFVAGPAPDGRVDAAAWLREAADQLEAARIRDLGEDRYEIAAGNLTGAQLEAMLLPSFTRARAVVPGAFSSVQDGVLVQIDRHRLQEAGGELDVPLLVARATAEARTAAENLRQARAQAVLEETVAGETRNAFELITTESNRQLVAEALMATMGDLLEATRPVEAVLVADAQRAPDGIFPILPDDEVLSDVIGGEIAVPVAAYKGGLAMVFDQLTPPQTTDEVEQRLREMRLQPDFEGVAWRNSLVVGLQPAPGSPDRPLYSRIAVLVNDPHLLYVEGADNATWQAEVAQRELLLSQAALSSSRTLQRVTQFDAQVATEAAQLAIIAILLSLIVVAAYLWIRFGSVDFGLAGIIALYHDVAIALTAVVACHFLYDTPIGHLLMLRDFRIDLNVIAALLTIVGFSINDTIVIFDRIRENRGRMGTVSAGLINNALNQTLSRTILTTATLLLVVLIMFIAGGEGIHGFAFTLMVGAIAGTYSTLAIATPMLYRPRVMWGTAIVLAALTAIGLSLMIGLAPVRWAMIGLIIAGAAYALVRQLSTTPGLSREPQPVGR